MKLIDADAALEAVCEEVMDRFFVPPSVGYDVAEEALKKLPSIQPETNCSEIPNNTDTISRQAALEAIRTMQTYKLYAGDDMILIDKAEVQTELMRLPSAQPEQRWIPCSERQPDVNGWYITTISGEICGQDRAFSGMSEFANGKWMSGDDVDETEMTIAWMPLPEPARLEND